MGNLEIVDRAKEKLNTYDRKKLLIGVGIAVAVVVLIVIIIIIVSVQCGSSEVYPGPGEKIEKFRQQALQKHNEYRRMHGVPDLKLDQKLNKFSQEWAEYLASCDRFAHRDPSDANLDGEQTGENLFWYSTRINATHGVIEWYNEIKDFQFDKPDGRHGGAVVGHFTQIVWAASKKLGVGFALSGNGGVYMVCNYIPAGNYRGRFGKNVPRPVLPMASSSKVGTSQVPSTTTQAATAKTTVTPKT